MKLIFKTLGYLLSIPARIKGVKFGKKSFIGPGYDFMFYQLKNITLGDNVFIDKYAYLRTIGSGIIKIGDGTNIGRNITISSCRSIIIGKKCSISYNVSILDHNHNFNLINGSIIHNGITSNNKIKIGDDCFIGAHSFILNGVQLGEHCVVGANSVVTKSFPNYSIIAGSPAKLIKKIIK